MNFKSYGNEPPGEGGSGTGRSEVNFPLARQTSIYSLTFDELQSTMGGPGKDFGSMNMDELLKSIWSAEETQTMMGSTSSVQEGGVPGGYLQRQGSLTLPRTLSTKTVDEVWKNISKEYGEGKDGNSFGGSNLPQMQRQQTLGEITLEEFLVKAGVVMEDNQLNGKTSNTTGLFGNFLKNNPAYGTGFQQTDRNAGLMGNRIPESTNQITFQSANLPLNVNGVRSTQQQQQLFPKPTSLAYAPPMAIPSIGQLGSPVIKGSIARIPDQALNCNLVNNSGLQGGGIGMVGLGAGAAAVATGSPAVSSDGLGKSNGDTSSVSPVPYVFNGGLRGRKSSTVEKVVERRQRRMIKNRESAARSRARKQVYVLKHSLYYIYIITLSSQ